MDCQNEAHMSLAWESSAAAMIIIVPGGRQWLKTNKLWNK